MNAAVELTAAERSATVTALREWLATYSQGVRPDGYKDAESAMGKILKTEDL